LLCLRLCTEHLSGRARRAWDRRERGGRPCPPRARSCAALSPSARRTSSCCAYTARTYPRRRLRLGTGPRRLAHPLPRRSFRVAAVVPPPAPPRPPRRRLAPSRRSPLERHVDEQAIFLHFDPSPTLPNPRSVPIERGVGSPRGIVGGEQLRTEHRRKAGAFGGSKRARGGRSASARRGRGGQEAVEPVRAGASPFFRELVLPRSAATRLSSPFRHVRPGRGREERARGTSGCSRALDRVDLGKLALTGRSRRGTTAL